MAEIYCCWCSFTTLILDNVKKTKFRSSAYVKDDVKGPSYIKSYVATMFLWLIDDLLLLICFCANMLYVLSNLVMIVGVIGHIRA